MTTCLIIGSLLPISVGLSLCFLCGKNISPVISSALLTVFGIVSVAGAVTGFFEPSTYQIQAPFYLGVAPFLFLIDRLSSLFLLLLGVVCISISLFIPGYLKHLPPTNNPVIFWVGLFLFAGSMSCVTVAANALTFLVFWEIMSLSSAMLVAIDLTSKASRRATFIYLGATRIATALISVGFLAFGTTFGSWSFSDWNAGSSLVFVPALLMLLGFSVKVGLWPFHIWLPYAHPAAPAPVSALMSGVMIKIALYAIIRIFVMSSTASEVLALCLLFMGVISALWGILFALVQQDLKRLLAYSSVENVGLIAIGIAVCLYCKATGLSAIVEIGLVAALFHCLNHGVFKALLFLSVGAIDASTGTRDLSRLGGLSSRMPFTMFALILGSAAICALPPLNGFASKWLIYQSLFQAITRSNNEIMGVVFLVSIGSLAMVSGLAIACFTKAIGISCLGRPRSQAASQAHEASPAMLISLAILSVTCIALAVAAPLVCQTLTGVAVLPTNELSNVLSLPLPAINASFVLIASFCLILASYRRKKRIEDTWECGYGPLSNRMQITAGSFAQPIAAIFSPILSYHSSLKISGKDRKHFPEKVQSETLMIPLLETKLYNPIVSLVVLSGRHFARLQAGSVHMYLFYVLVSLIALLVVGSIL